MEQKNTLIATGTDGKNSQEISTTPRETKVIEIAQSPKEMMAVAVKKPHKNHADAATVTRRAEVMQSIELTGGYGLPVKALAERHGVHPRIIYKDIEYLIKNIPTPNIDEIGRKFKITYETIIQKGNKMLFDPDKGVQKDGAELLLKAADSYTTFLERYGYKNKIVPNTMPINVTVDNRSVEVVNVKFEVPKEMEEFK